MQDLSGNAHLRGQVGGPDQQSVDPFDRGNPVGIGEPFGALDHRDHQDFRVDRGLGLGVARRLVAEQSRRSAPAPRPQRRVTKGGGDAPGLIDRIDMRYDDARGAVVERAGALVERAGADAHDRGDAGRQCGNADLGDVILRKRAVLHVDEQPVVPGRGRDHARRRGAQMVHAESEREPAARNFLIVAFSTRGICFSVMSRICAWQGDGYTAELSEDVKDAPPRNRASPGDDLVCLPNTSDKPSG